MRIIFIPKVYEEFSQFLNFLIISIFLDYIKRNGRISPKRTLL
ncbi:hypothetical protein DSUL_100075 [Desulfovibrionales bacterium]